MKYSPSTESFYSDPMEDGLAIPEDCIDVSDADYAAWLAAAAGSSISIVEGKFTLLDPVYRFAPSTGCFYPPDITYSEYPTDTVTVTAQEFSACLAAAPGSTFAFVDGVMVIKPPADVTAEDKLAALISYAESRRKRIADGGISVNVGATDVPVLCSVDTSASGLGNLYAMQMRAMANQSGSFTWYQSSGNIAVTAANISTIAVSVGSFIDLTFAALDTVRAAIDTGSVTTTAEIDAADWPANS